MPRNIPTIEFCRNLSKEFGYDLLSSEWLGNRTKMNFFHEKCGTYFSAYWQNFKSRNGSCPKCGEIKNGLSHRLDLNKSKEYALKRGYLLLENEYVPTDEKSKFKHIENGCNFEFKMCWSHFLKGSGCQRCAGVEIPTLEFCKEESLKRGYILKSDVYLGSHGKLKFYHIECERNFDMEWNAFHNIGQNCPLCKLDNQESCMATNLKQHYCEYFNAIPEYEKCINPKTGNYLPYDIFIPRFNNDGYDIFIEVQGEQHYKFTPYFYKTLEDFKYQQYKDKIKKDYAEQNGIYIEIDLRQKTPIEDIIQKINNTIQTYS